MTECPGVFWVFLMGAGHLGPVCSALLKIQILRREADIQHNCTGCTNC